jgi:hypothetical protein
MKTNQTLPSTKQTADIIAKLLDGLNGIDREGAQALLESKEFGWGLPKFIERHACFPREEVVTELGYPKDYKPLPIREQIMTLANKFNLDPTTALQHMRSAGDKPHHAEAWFAVINWRVLGDNYIEQCQKIFQWIAERSYSEHYERDRFNEYVTGGFKDYQYGFTNRYKEKFPGFNSTHDGPILIMPAQFGKGRAGQTPRRADALCRTTDREYPLSVFEVACMIALHPMRLAADPERGKKTVLRAYAAGTLALPQECHEHCGWEGSTHQHKSFSFFGEAANTTSDYGRLCNYWGNHDGCDKEYCGPVTAWTWSPHRN